MNLERPEGVTNINTTTTTTGGEGCLQVWGWNKGGV